MIRKIAWLCDRQSFLARSFASPKIQLKQLSQRPFGRWESCASNSRSFSGIGSETLVS